MEEEFSLEKQPGIVKARFFQEKKRGRGEGVSDASPQAPKCSGGVVKLESKAKKRKEEERAKEAAALRILFNLLCPPWRDVARSLSLYGRNQVR